MRPIRRVMCVVGARPNFMKTAPVIAALAHRGERITHSLVHTGQHHDDGMSRVFLEQLRLGGPDHALGVGSGTHAGQTARVLERLEPILAAEQPDLVLVPGDTNSTLAAALAAAKLDIPVGHIEAGLRSFDRSMPEELNRMLTDQISSLLFIHSPEARENLLREGVGEHRIHAVGNTMIDTLVAMRARIAAVDAAGKLGLGKREYLVVTLHRPALVDGPLLAEAIAALDQVSAELPVVFPIHPRTAKMMDRQGLRFRSRRVRLVDPLGYTEFLSLVADASGVLTDSGGIQEETTYLGVPCLTLRDNTERPITCSQGTNVLLGLAPECILRAPDAISDVRRRPAQIPPGWDGAAAERLVDVLELGVPGWDAAPVASGRPA